MGALAFAASLVRSLAWPAAAVILGLIFRRPIRAVFAGLAASMDQLESLQGWGLKLSFRAGIRSLVQSARTLPVTPGAVTEPGPGPASVIAAAALRALFARRGPRGQDEAAAGETADRHLIRELPDHVTFRAGGREVRADLIPLTADNLADQAEISPVVTVLTAWTQLEVAVNTVADVLAAGDEASFAVRSEKVITELNRRGVLPAPGSTLEVIQKLLRLRQAAARGAPVTRQEAYDYAATALRVSGLLLSACARLSPEAEDARPDGDPLPRL